MVLDKYNSILKEVSKSIIPTKKESEKVMEIAQEVLQIVNEKAEKFKAELVIGGSVAKGTWLPGIHDIDCFLRFDHIQYKDKSDQLAEITEKIIKNCFSNYKRLHGSRDYFQTNYMGFDIEIIPVLKITKPNMMKNITDVSPLHFIWLRKRTRQLNLGNEIRIAKKFFKANNLYGAESFIRGISGHVIEVMIIHYGSFIKLLKAISKWQDKSIIDPENRYMNEKQMMLLMNESKTVSPLIVVDPIQPERNASAALSKDKFEALKKLSNKFLNNPSPIAFKEKILTADKIKARKSVNKLLLFSAIPDPEVTKDVAGCKILKQFEDITNLIKGFDFKIVKNNWYWDKKSDALIWFYIDPKKLAAQFRHWGPPIKLIEHATAFRKEWKKYKVKEFRGKLYVDLPRKIRTTNDFLVELKQSKDINVKILC
jgi:tRNA nucleotidyltransferase (CCA-adding enzyme)